MKINPNPSLPNFPNNPLPGRASSNPLPAERLKQQIAVFRLVARQLSLPISDPYTFFTSFITRFGSISSSSEKDRACALGLLLDYHYLGNLAFDSAVLDSPPDFHRIYPLFSELLQHEEWNSKLAAYRKRLQQGDSTKSVDAIRLSDHPVVLCLDIFRKLRRQRNSHAQSGKLSAAQTQLELGLQLEKLECTGGGDARLSQQDMIRSVQELTRLLRSLSAQTVKALPADLRNFAYAVDDKTAHDEQRSRRNSRLLEQLVAVSERSKAAADSEIVQVEQLSAVLKTLLRSRFQLPPYLFFAHAFSALEQNDCLKSLAPVYLYSLFMQHGESITAKRVSKGIFTPMQLFSLESHTLSEERTSSALQEADYEAFSALCALYQQILIERQSAAFAHLTRSEQHRELYLRGLLDLPMCEFIFQRLTRTQRAGSSNTSILGEQMKKAKPLFRGFALIDQTIAHMLDYYSVRLPYLNTLSCSSEQAEAFYTRQTGIRQADKPMEYLLEQENSKTLQAKKRLTLARCRQITKAAFPSADDLRQTIQAYIDSDQKLSSYAQQGALQNGCLHTAVYRLALVREASRLSRQFSEDCVDLFYTPVSEQRLSEVWQKLFITAVPAEYRKPFCFYRFRFDAFTNETLSRLYLSRQPTVSYNALIYCASLAQLNTSLRLPDTAQPIYYECTNDLIDCIISSYTGDFRDREALLSHLQNRIAQVYHAVCQAKFTGLIFTYDVTALPVILLKNGFGDISTESEIVFLYSLTSEYTRVLQEFRKLSIPEFPIIFRIVYRDDYGRLSQKILPVLCHWLYDSGASAIILSHVPCCACSSSTEFLTISNAIAKDLCLPICCETNEIEYNLSDYPHISGFCLNIPR